MAGLTLNSELKQIIEEILTLQNKNNKNNNNNNLFSKEDISTLQSNLNENYISSKSLTLISIYLKNEKKNQNLKTIIKGTKLKFPHFITPIVEVCLSISLFLINFNYF